MRYKFPEIRHLDDVRAAIEAYKFNDNIVPVDRAKIVKAYQCPWTGRIVETKKTYVKHLKALRDSRIHARIRAARMQRMQDDLSSQPDWPSVIQWVERNSHWFLARAKHSRGINSHDKWPEPEDFWVRITYLDIHHSDMVSNSHNRPRNGVTNWGGKTAGAPRGYPGWHGSIEFQFSHALPSFSSSDAFRGTGINTGSGGGIKDNRYGYGVKLFDSDWPAMDQQRILNVLTEHGSYPPFRYGTPVYFR